MSDDEKQRDRAAYGYFVALTTRWMDNDAYGHINNVVYYSYFDTAANHYLIHEGGLDVVSSPVIGLVVESRCRYREALAYPDELDVGLTVVRLGARSVTYGIGVFRRGAEKTAADGTFAHVFVDRVTRRPTAIPDGIRAALERLVGAGPC